VSERSDISLKKSVYTAWNVYAEKYKLDLDIDCCKVLCINKKSKRCGLKEGFMITLGENKKKKRFVIYTRCSVEDEDENKKAKNAFTTHDVQAHHCKNMLDAFGHELAIFGKKGIVTDDGYSGKNLNRPGIQMILNSLQKHQKFDGIIFFRLDRLTRNPRDLYALIDLFKEKGIDFISVRENLDSTTAIGRVVIGIIGLLAAFERELTGERVKASAIARVRQGKWVGGFLPYGYKLVNDGKPLADGRQPHKVVLDEEIAPKLKMIWEMAADNKSLTEIGQNITQYGIKSCHGKDWRKQSLSALIKNPFYKGYLLYAGELHKGKHDAIVESELWEKANKILTAKLPGHGFRKAPKEYDYLLSGILKCGECGSNLISVSSRSHTGVKFFYYVCGRSKQGLGCNQDTISATVFDKALIDYFRKASKDQEIIVKALGDAILDAQAKLDKLEVVIKKESTNLDAVKTEAKKILELAINGTISEGFTYKTKMAELDEEILKIEDKLTKLQAQKTAAQMSAHAGKFIYTNIGLALQYLDKASAEAQKILLRALIKEIVIFDNRIELRMNLVPSEEVISSERNPFSVENNLKNGKSPIKNDEALTTQSLGSSNCPKWLPGQDSNLRPSGYELTLIAQRVGLYLYHSSFRTLGSECLVSARFPKEAWLGPSIISGLVPHYVRNFAQDCPHGVSLNLLAYHLEVSRKSC
jgi:site-specific DNA recombinase